MVTSADPQERASFEHAMQATRRQRVRVNPLTRRSRLNSSPAINDLRVTQVAADHA